MDPATAVGLASLMLSLANGLYLMVRDRSGDAAAIERRLSILETHVSRVMTDTGQSEHRMTALETKVEVFWATVGIDAARILHSPDPAKHRQDYLLERFMDDTLAGEEAGELIAQLTSLAENHDAQPGERLAAAVVLRAMEIRYGVRITIADPPDMGRTPWPDDSAHV